MGKSDVWEGRVQRDGCRPCRVAVLVPEPQEPQELEADNRRIAPRINRQVDSALSHARWGRRK